MTPETVCAKRAEVLAERGRAERRVELEAAIKEAARELAKTGPTKLA